MKVGRLSLVFGTPPAQSSSTESVKKDVAAVATSYKDSVSVSASDDEESEAARAARKDQVAAQVRNGSYSVDSRDVARALIAELG